MNTILKSLNILRIGWLAYFTGLLTFYSILPAQDSTKSTELLGIALLKPQVLTGNPEDVWIGAAIEERFYATGQFSSRSFNPDPKHLDQLLNSCPFEKQERCFEQIGEKLKITVFTQVNIRQDSGFYNMEQIQWLLNSDGSSRQIKTATSSRQAIKMVEKGVEAIYSQHFNLSPLMKAQLEMFPDTSVAAYGCYAIGVSRWVHQEVKEMFYPLQRASELGPGFAPWSAAWMSKAYLSMGKTEKSIQILNAVEPNKRDWKSYLALAEANFAAHKAPEAQGNLVEAKKTLPAPNAEYEYLLSRGYQASGFVSRALSHIIVAIHRNPSVIAYYQLLGELYGSRGNYASALPYFQRLIKLAPDNKEHKLFYGMALRDNQELSEAMAVFREILLTHPKFFPARINLGITYMHLGWREKAQRSFEIGIERKEGVLESKLNLALLKIESGQLKEGLHELEKLAKENPEEALLQLNLGLTYLKTGAKVKAEKFLKLSLSLNANQPQALLSLASISHDQGKSREEFGYLSRLLELDPDNLEALKKLAANSAESGEYSEAVSYLRSALEQSGSGPEEQMLLARYTAKLGEHDQAREYLITIRDKQQSAPEILYQVAETFFDLSFYKEAIEIAEQLLERNYKTGRNHFLLGRCYTEQIVKNQTRRVDSPSQALKHLQIAYQMQADSWTSSFGLARYYAKVELNYGKAQSLLQESESLKPTKLGQQEIESERQFILQVRQN